MDRSIIWVDVETTGVNPEEDSLLEIASIVTDMKGNHLSDLVEVLIPPNSIGDAQALADNKVLKMHEKSGLWADLWDAKVQTLANVDDNLASWVDDLDLNPRNTFFGGNSIMLDREFVSYSLPMFYSRFSHRSLDVTSIALMVQSNFSLPLYLKNSPHRAGIDVLESIDEYKYYLGKISIT